MISHLLLRVRACLFVLSCDYSWPLGQLLTCSLAGCAATRSSVGLIGIVAAVVALALAYTDTCGAILGPVHAILTSSARLRGGRRASEQVANECCCDAHTGASCLQEALLLVVVTMQIARCCAVRQTLVLVSPTRMYTSASAQNTLSHTLSLTRTHGFERTAERHARTCAATAAACTRCS